MRIVRIAVVLVTGLFLSAGVVGAQTANSAGRHITDRAAIDQALTAKTASQDQQRDVIRRALQRPEAQKIASQFGLTLTQVDAAVGTLSDQDLDRVATQATRVEASYAGGDTIVISVTTLLLVLILVVLIAR